MTAREAEIKVLPVALVSLNSEMTHMGQVPMKNSPIPPEPESSGLDDVFLDSEPTCGGDSGT
jgi:hypothetical protein